MVNLCIHFNALYFSSVVTIEHFNSLCHNDLAPLRNPTIKDELKELVLIKPFFSNAFENTISQWRSHRFRKDFPAECPYCLIILGEIHQYISFESRFVWKNWTNVAGVACCCLCKIDILQFMLCDVIVINYLFKDMKIYWNFIAPFL